MIRNDTRGKIKTRLAGKNLLFAELIIVIFFFSLAAAGCVMLFAQAQVDGQYSQDLTNAVVMAQNTAEKFKATGEVHHTEADGLRQHSELNESEDILKLHIKVLKGEEVIYELITAIPKGVGS